MLRRYAFTWCYLGIYVVTEIIYAELSPSAQNTFSVWVSTSVVNLEHDPVLVLVTSVFVGQGDYLAWPVLIALALFGANHALGNLRTLAICVAGNVIGSLVSEGIVAYRVDAGQLPASYRHLIDVGPSYVVMAAIVVALLCGGWLARAAAAFDLGILVFVGNIFGGLSSLEVAAVGHLVSGITAAACAGYILLHRRRTQPALVPEPVTQQPLLSAIWGMCPRLSFGSGRPVRATRPASPPCTPTAGSGTTEALSRIPSLTVTSPGTCGRSGPGA